MRSSPALSETRFSFSFFLTTPARKPRTECCCQSVAFIIAAIVVPFGCRSIASTASCLDGPDALAEAGLPTVTHGTAFGFDEAGPFAETVPFAARGDLRAALVDLDFDLLVAIWLSLA